MTEAVESDLVIERRGPALWATINRPERRNALNAAVFAGFTEAIRIANADPGIRVMVWTAAGDRAFCAGGDLKPEKGVFEFDPAQPTTTPVNLMRTVIQSSVPIVGRINGHCMAGGMGLLGMCDIAVAVEGARFGLPEVKLGLFPMQILPLLQELLPRRALTELCLTGEPITAMEAKALDLLNHVVPAEELDAKVDAIVTSLAAASPTAIRRGKYALRYMAAMTIEEALAFSEAQVAVMVQTEDAREGKLAFNERRKPQWTNR